MSNGMMIGLALAVVVVLGVMFMPRGAAGYETKALSAAELASSNALVVDIRRPEEWEQSGVIAGAKLITFANADSFLAAVGKDLPEGRPLVLVCHSGRRSAAAAAALAGKIGNPIISQAGGMSAWVANGGKVVSPR